MFSLKGTFILLLLFFSSFFGSIFMLAPFLPVMLLSPSCYRWITDRIVAVWLTLPVALLEMVLGVRVVVTGDGFIPGERTVIIMNHRTRLDWMYLWNCLLRYSYLRMEKICLKSSLKSIPGFGWAMQVAAFIFVRRNWEEDQEYLSLMLEYLCDIKHPLQLLMFPEGTDLTDFNKARSDEFAAARGLPTYEYVLHPRTNGFSFIVEQLRKGCNLDAIHDVTVAYPYNIPQNERDLFTGNFPREIHFHIRRYPAAYLPTSVEGLKEWCCLRWQDKEKLLRTYYQGNRSFSDQAEIQSQAQILIQSQVQVLSQIPDQSRVQAKRPFRLPFLGNAWSRRQRRVQVSAHDWGQGRGEGQAPLPPCKSRGRVFLIKFLSIVYWTVFVLTMFVVIWSYNLARWYLSIVAIFFMLQEKVFGGCEVLELSAHNSKAFRQWRKRH
ncbi:lysocardiolipin acyltransferase 1 isoform X1 [Scyliorhinus torazame]